ncbi:restriction endonuclease [Caballeronia sp. LjRoot29]|uniref:restriction endonuclease n=1 Tax=Caballeronia sp. LjRoot29 TaxID=3342315 RepID=UPI003ECFDC8F
MIDNPYPNDWRELQNGVCRLFNEIGLTASVEKDIQTPRGTVAVDVYAVDEQSVDKIRYIVECKNWGSAIPQTVVHAFTTVMAETGANIGFIVSLHGLQAGAIRYTNNTSTHGLTYLELQKRYLPVWWERHFCPAVGDAADDLMQYVEPFNGARDRQLALLSGASRQKYKDLVNEFGTFGMTLSFFNIGQYINARRSPNFTGDLLVPSEDVETFKEKMLMK